MRSYGHRGGLSDCVHSPQSTNLATFREQMPILDGIATIRIIRPMQAEQALKGHISTLAVTANARAEQIQTMELAGLYGIVTIACRLPLFDAICARKRLTFAAMYASRSPSRSRC